ncbi:centromere-associated protein E-like [Chenopodium quinoa]|uniref:centromere-associated protein E-like n=1 Tax=Chenopodium quinoa TaxID=63459 RepID=UPI000B7872B7|nr:centromere-associated protein E-like [Chenopodium quinoa]XP_021744103.1 centromere-associated protein E-like [Chenopodium quinoa]XP_021744111.1 centromere-associated protein E-like [Chenopodium quinoa]
MSGNYDSENNPETSSAVAGINDDDEEDVGVNSESTNNQEMSSREANYDSNNSNDDGVIVNADNNGSGGDSDGVVVSEDAGREDMFLDAPEDLGADGRESMTQESPEWEEDRSHEPRAQFSGLDNEMQNDYMVDEMERLRAMLDKTVNEKESIVREHKDEMEMAAKGIANLRDQMRDLINKQLLLNEKQSGSLDRFHADEEQTPLHELIHECSMFVRNVVEEFQDLNTKSTEASVSREVVNSYMNSVQNESAEVQFQKDQYMEDATNRMLSSFASVVYVGELLDNSLVGKIAHVEKSVFSLMENYNWFLYQGDQLRQCLAQLRPELAEQADFGVIYAAANEELLGFRNKETEFVEKMSHMESENSKLMEQLGMHRAIADSANAELEKLKAELEQEKHRYSNTKEKLSMAVTKGKALVQQRDSLKQTIADKTSELEKCLVELQEKSSALEAAELIKEELVKSQMSGASLQDMLVQKDLMLEKLEDIILQSGIPEVSTSKDVTERIRWLVEERNALKDDSMKFHQLADALLSIDLPENISFSDLESRLNWLAKSFDQANTEIGKLQDEITRTRESLMENSRIRDMASNEMDHLVASLSTVLVEKDYVTMELDDMSHRFEAVLQREHQAVSEKEDMLRILLEASEVTADESQLSEAGVLVEKCLASIKERSSSTHESSEVKDDFYQTLQKLLYVKDQDLALHENLLEDETQKMKAAMDKLLVDSTKASEEIATLQEHNDKLQKDLERTEEKSSLIREKLSMAVKKGKGLVQEREGLKQLIDEKSSEIEKLKLELEQKVLAISNYEDETSRLSEQVQGIAKLEEDLLALNDQRNLLERDLSMSNKLLNSLTESISSITLPADSSFEEPVEKLRWLAGYLSECEIIKEQAQQQLENALLEIETLTTNVSEAQSAIKPLEDALAVAEEKFSQLAQEKTELEVGRASAQEQLDKAILEAQLFAEAGAAKVALENSLAVAETNLSKLGKEKEEAESSRFLAEEELDKARSEIIDLTSKLSNATTTVKTLEDTVSHLESRISVLTDENNAAQVIRTNLEKDLKELKEEADIWDSKLQEAHSRVKSLEDALSKAENDFAELDSEKKAAEQEISTLSSKLNTCLEELAGTHGSLESRSLELFDHLKGLELLGEDETLLSSLRIFCESKFESLKEMENFFNIIRGQCAKLSPENYPVSEEPSCLSKLFSVSLDEIVSLNSVSGHADAVEGSDISLYVQKIAESFHMRKRTFSEKVDGFSSFLSECDTSIVRELQSTSKLITSMAEELQFLDQKVKSMETDYQALENKVVPLEDDVSLLLSACTEATQVLQSEVDKQMAEITTSCDHVENEPKFSENKHVKATEMLLFATRKACGVCKQLENSRNEFSSKVEELQDSLNELKIVADKSLEERDLSNTKVRELETNLAELQNTCNELKIKMENNQELEASLREKDVEISSLQSSLLMKEKEAGEALYWASHVENLVSRTNGIDVLMEDSQGGDLEPQDSSQIKKLLYVVDTFPELQHQIELLSHEKEELQTALTDQLHEIEHLKERIQESIGHEQELAIVRSKVINMESGLDRIIQKFATRDIIGDPLSTDDILQVIEEQVVTTISNSENLKTKVHELELEVKKSINSEQELAKLKEQLLDLEAGVQRIIKNLGGDEIDNLKPLATSDLIQVLEKMVMALTLECEKLKAKDHELGSEIWKDSDELELAEVKGQLVDLESGLQRIIHKIRGNAIGDQGTIPTRDLLQLLEKMVVAIITESENSKSEVHELDSKLYGSQKAVDELLLKVKELEDLLQSRVVPPDTIQERSLFEATSQPSASEISEIEDVGSISKATISPVPSSTHVRTLRKGSSDHIAVNIDSESSRLLDNEPVEDKGHVFKSLNTSGLVPIQGKILADRIDGIWVSGGRLLMSRPRARLGFIAYWLFLHIWLLGTIL